MRIYEGVHAIIATPGRILDLTEKGIAKMDLCKMLVLDEVSPLVICSYSDLSHSFSDSGFPPPHISKIRFINLNLFNLLILLLYEFVPTSFHCIKDC